MKINFGVIDVPEPEGGTTHSVGMDLEKRYHLFSQFADYDLQRIANDLAESATAAIETMELTGNVPSEPFAQAGELITDRFKKFITDGTIETLGIPGVPTKAALEGRSLRTKNGKNIGKVRKGQAYKEVIGPRRASFVYSGVLESSLKVWVD